MQNIGLQRIELFNFGIHEHLVINPNGESMIVVGDSGTGKTTLSKAILAHIDQGGYPTNPLADGKDEGFTKSHYTAANGKTYTVIRKFFRRKDGTIDNGRFEVRGPDNSKLSLKNIMSDVFNNVFTHSKFEFNEYFNKRASPTARYQYMRDAIGGDVIDKNQEDITKWEKERGPIGTQREVKKELWNSIDLDTVDERAEYFDKERDQKEAEDAKKKHLDTQKPVADLKAKLDAHVDSTVEIDLINQAIRMTETEIVDIEEQIKKLQELLGEKKTEIAEAKGMIKQEEKKLLSKKAYDKVTADLAKIEQANAKIVLEADKIYTDTLNDIIEFGIQKAAFLKGVDAYEEWLELDAKWNDLDAKIKAKREENDAFFKAALPLKELSIGQDKSGSLIVLYNGREFSADNLSTGEQIRITAEIQLALNPNGGNFIIIPNAQDLGSKLKEVRKACEKFNVQYLVEMTVPDAEFAVEIIEATPE
jgi:GTPase SAR1 family protein